MSKTNATRAFLSTLVLCCLPLAAATISSDGEVSMRLGWDAHGVGPNQYEVTAGGVVMLDVTAPAGDLLGIFLIPADKSGQPDYRNAVQLFLEQTRDGRLTAFVEVPAELAGMTFYLRAAAQAADERSPILGPEIQLAILGHLVQAPKGNGKGK